MRPDKRWRLQLTGGHNDPKHRLAGEYIAYEKDLPNPNDALHALRRKGRGVMLYYPITPTGKGSGKVKPPYSTGFTVLFPPNDIRTPITFCVFRSIVITD